MVRDGWPGQAPRLVRDNGFGSLRPGRDTGGPRPAVRARREVRSVAVVTSSEDTGTSGFSGAAGPVLGIPVSAGALIFDRAGRLLILKPIYKSGWTIPGGVMGADGETPWQACRREVREECGLEVRTGRLACVDFRRPRPGKPGGVRFLFDCGRMDDAALGAVVLQREEISEYRMVSLDEALTMLRGPIKRRVREATAAKSTVYL